jgi:hypothetical protein
MHLPYIPQSILQPSCRHKPWLSECRSLQVKKPPDAANFRPLASLASRINLQQDVQYFLFHFARGQHIGPGLFLSLPCQKF